LRGNPRVTNRAGAVEVYGNFAFRHVDAPAPNLNLC
jgi:hypothetical protein